MTVPRAKHPAAWGAQGWSQLALLTVFLCGVVGRVRRLISVSRSPLPPVGHNSALVTLHLASRRGQSIESREGPGEATSLLPWTYEALMPGG